jgi:AcrR family transcriptional regulator
MSAMTFADRADPRTQRSIAALQDALADLTGTASPSNIDVSALCRTAGVHRTTFYKYFDTVTQLAASLLTDLFARIDCPSSRAEHGFARWLTALLEQVAQNRRTYRRFLTPEGDPALMRTVCDRITARVRQALAAAAARGHEAEIDQNALAMTLGFGSYGLIEAVLTNKHIDISDAVNGILGTLPDSLRPSPAP